MDVNDLVELGADHCRVEFNARVTGAARAVGAVCGKLATECSNRHTAQRDAGERRDPGGYARLLGHSFPGHGMANGVYLTPSRLAHAREGQEQARQAVPPPTPLRVGGIREPHTPTTTQEREVDGFPPTPAAGTTRVPQGHPTSPAIWMGLVNEVNLRVLAQLPSLVAEWRELGYLHRHTFTDYDEATEWVAQGASSEPTQGSQGQDLSSQNHTGEASPREEDSDPDSASSEYSDDSPWEEETRKRTNKGSRGREGEEESSGEEQARSPRRKSRRRRQRRKHRSARRRHRRTHSSSSSESSRSRGTRERHRHLPKGKSLFEGDKSTGEEELFGMDLGSDELTASLGPKGMTRNMIPGLFEFPTDVLALPGGYGGSALGSGQEESPWGDPDQWINQVNALLKTTPEGRDREHDPNWKAVSHQALSKVNSLESLNRLIDGYQRTLPRATKFENQRLTHWLRRGGYRSSEIEHYQRQGGLPIVLRDLAKYYFALLMKLQSEANKSSPRWSNTYAESMLKYHARELAYIRSMAGTREDLILTNYTYLRDAYKAKFTTLELQDSVIKETLLRSNESKAEEGGGGSTGDTARKRGCRCQNNKLHRLLNLRYFDTDADVCPVAAAQGAQKARAAAKMLVSKVESYEGTPSQSTWKGWASKAVEAAKEGRSSF